MNAPTIAIYRMLKIPFERNPGCFYYEIECRLPTGETAIVAVCDTREEAAETIKAMRKAADNQ